MRYLSDIEKVCEQRIRVYREKTEPVIDFYENSGILIRLPVKKGIDDVPEFVSKITSELQ